MTNYSALRKIMKKHDKVTNRKSGSDWMKEVVDSSPIKGDKKTDKKTDKMKDNIEVFRVVWGGYTLINVSIQISTVCIKSLNLTHKLILHPI